MEVQPAMQNGLDNRYRDTNPYANVGKQKLQNAAVPMYEVVDDDIVPTSQLLPTRSKRQRTDDGDYATNVKDRIAHVKSVAAVDPAIARTQSLTQPRAQVPEASLHNANSSSRAVSDPLRNSKPIIDAAADEQKARRTSAYRDSRASRGSYTERSPLQQLEGHLGNISKEEKRARVREAELAHERRTSAARESAGHESDPVVSAPIVINGQTYVPISTAKPEGQSFIPSDAGVPSRQDSASRRQKYGARESDVAGAAPTTLASGSSGTIARDRESLRQGRDIYGPPPLVAGVPQSEIVDQQPPADRNAGSFMKDRFARQKPHALAEKDDPEMAAAQLPGHYGPHEVPQEFGRSNSRKLQKRRPVPGPAVEPPKNRSEQPAQVPPQPDRTVRNSRYSEDSSNDDDPDLVARDDVRLPPNASLTYRTNPQTKGAHQARRVLDGNGEFEPVHDSQGQSTRKKPGRLSGLFGFGKKGKADEPDHDATNRHDAGQKHSRPDLDNNRGDSFRRPHAPVPFPDDWRRMRPIFLDAPDLDLDMPLPKAQPQPPVPAKESEDKAWWEKSEGERRQSAGPATQSKSSQPVSIPSYDGNVDARSGQTYFKPQLYLKCGPLLRFTGIKPRRQSSSGGRAPSRPDAEIWRGSIMIVTYDSKSDYRTPPTLRLFKQPVTLLPPPPTEVGSASASKQNLAPEYVDPVAGQMKMSRVGKTLFVKPVEELEEGKDLSRLEDDRGLFTERRSAATSAASRSQDGEKAGKVKEMPGTRLYAERGVTFWKWNIEIELGTQQARIAYRINRGPAVGFWVPARGEMMNIMFHSCNGFSLGVDTDDFSGPDPLWRDVLNTHQFRPFHVMIGGGDQLYNDAATVQTKHFKAWAEMKNPHHKRDAKFTFEMQDELEQFYLNRYAMWFSQGMFAMANSQIPMVNIWDDHDIIDGFGSYPHHTMACPVFTGLGAIAFKYYMLFQHQSSPAETEREEPSWLLGSSPGPYIEQLSRSIFLNMGRSCAFLGIDCRTERMRDSILCQESWDLIFDRCRHEIIKGVTKHFIVLLGVPIAYPRLNFLENFLTSRAMDPIKALGKTGMLGGFVNKFDGGVEILDDLDDHWTAKHHKQERNYFIQELQEMAAEKSVRITILGGDVHLAAIGQFYSNKKLRLAKDRDHRYMPNVISSAIVNTPPPDMMADVLNKRNKIHHLDEDTDEDMIAIFFKDVDGNKRNNTHLLPRRNWCSIREYHPGYSPPPTPPTPAVPRTEDEQDPMDERPAPRRSISLGSGRPSFMRRFSKEAKSKPPPISYYNAMGRAEQDPPSRRASLDDRRRNDQSGSLQGSRPEDLRRTQSAHSTAGHSQRPSTFHRRPTFGSIHENDDRGGHIDLTNGLDIHLNVETTKGDPSGITTPYRFIVPALDYQGQADVNSQPLKEPGKLKSLFGSFRGKKQKDPTPPLSESPRDSWDGSERSYSESDDRTVEDRRRPYQSAGAYDARPDVRRAGSSGPIATLPPGAIQGANQQVSRRPVANNAAVVTTPAAAAASSQLDRSAARPSTTAVASTAGSTHRPSRGIQDIPPSTEPLPSRQQPLTQNPTGQPSTTAALVAQTMARREAERNTQPALSSGPPKASTAVKGVHGREYLNGYESRDAGESSRRSQDVTNGQHFAKHRGDHDDDDNNQRHRHHHSSSRDNHNRHSQHRHHRDSNKHPSHHHHHHRHHSDDHQPQNEDATHGRTRETNTHPYHQHYQPNNPAPRRSQNEGYASPAQSEDEYYSDEEDGYDSPSADHRRYNDNRDDGRYRDHGQGQKKKPAWKFWQK